MFFLIPLGIAAVSTLSTSTIVGGAVAATAIAVGLKKVADRVEEDNIVAINQARKDSSELIKSYRSKAESNKNSYRAQKANELQKQISSCEMNNKDKETCFAQLNKMLAVK
ncbi:hypothetical protein [Treponema sp.]|uniref:hypothetical protein n=1 Tax=Treponema sp. TaxID=166 RepID=UPI0025805A88|nr:hypothetical protein [Treponema sp.]MBE6354736.1 hypothetical protein [Treponema sp.]